MNYTNARTTNRFPVAGGTVYLVPSNILCTTFNGEVRYTTSGIPLATSIASNDTSGRWGKIIFSGRRTAR